MDAQAQCQNRIIDGIQKEDNEKWHDLDKKVLVLFKEKLDLDLGSTDIERVQCLGKAKK